MPGWSFEKLVKNDTARSSGLGGRRIGDGYDPGLDPGLVRIGTGCPGCLFPASSLRSRHRPRPVDFCHSATYLPLSPYSLAGHVVLEPVPGRCSAGPPIGPRCPAFPSNWSFWNQLSMSGDGLALLRAARVFDDRAKLARHAVAKQVIVARPVGSAGGGGVVRCRRRPGLKILVGRERLGDEPRADRACLSASVSRLPWALSWNTRLPDSQQDQGIQHRAEQHGEDQQPEVRTQMSNHVLTPCFW